MVTAKDNAGRRRWTGRVAWLVPVGVVGAVAAGATLLASDPSGAAPTLATRTPAQIVAAVGTNAARTTLSGEISETVRLGLPDLPGEEGAASLSWQSFLTGTHRARVWIDGTTRQRAALIGQLSEADVVHSGRNVWTYTSETNTVSHTVLPAAAGRSADLSQLPVSPVAVARKVLAAVDPTTAVTLGASRVVAGRPAYTLVMTPRDHRSTVRRVTIAVDRSRSVPLQVQVYGAARRPAVEIGFTNISFARPAASTFAFRVPAGARVVRTPLSADAGRHGDHVGHHVGVQGPVPAPMSTPRGARTIGSGWTTVVELPDAAGAIGRLPVELDRLTTPVGTSGDRLLRTALLNVVIRADGRTFAGAVTPALLERVAAGAP